tara:strand:- start:179 stop:472 length:294 start_codon:yes stop_codon:yes gene_type:complete
MEKLIELLGRFKVGYIKDFLATINFLLLLVFALNINDLNKYKNYGLFLLIIFLCVDGYYSTNEEHHCINFGHNNPSYLLSASVVIILFLYIYTYLNV